MSQDSGSGAGRSSGREGVGVDEGGLEVDVTEPPLAPPRLADLGVDRLEVSGAPEAPVSAPVSMPAKAPTGPPGYAGSDPIGRSTVLIVGIDYAADLTQTAGHTTAMARSLAGVAERVMVFTGVTGDPTGFPATLEPKIDRHNRRSYGQDGRVHVVRHRHHVPSARPRALSRLRYEVGFLRATMGTPIRHVPDLVIGVTPSVGGAVAASRLARRYGTPLIVVVEDLAGGASARRGPLSSMFGWREAEALRHANRVVIAGPHLHNAVLSLGVAPDRIEQLHGVALQAPAPPVPSGPDGPGRPSARERLGWPEAGFVAVYSGNIGHTQDVPTIIRAAQSLSGRGDDIRFALVGDGSRREALELACAELPSVRFLDPVTGADYPTLLAAADVLVLTEPAGRPDRTLAGKLQSYLHAGRPVVAAVNPEGVTGRAVREVSDAVVTVPPGDPHALAAAIARLREERRPARGGPNPAEARRPKEIPSPDAGPQQRLRDIARSLLVRRSTSGDL